MGLPIARLVIATNENDILVHTLASGEHKLGVVKATITPSTDIQISSNFERLLFGVSDCNADTVQTLMRDIKTTGSYTLPQSLRIEIVRSFDAGTATEAETTDAITQTHAQSGYLCDPHTAVATLCRPSIHSTRDTDDHALYRAPGQVP